MKAAALVPLALLSACSREAAQSPPATENARAGNLAPASATTGTRGDSLLALAVAGNGLQIYDRQTEKSRLVPFGTQQDRVLGDLAFRGPPAMNRLDECGAGPLEAASWPDGLSLYFQDHALVGWATGPREDGKKNLAAVVTTEGIGPGNYRTELEHWYKVRVFESTLGEEFDAGDVFGLFDGSGPDPIITHMWAGVSCNMR